MQWSSVEHKESRMRYGQKRGWRSDQWDLESPGKESEFYSKSRRKPPEGLSKGMTWNDEFLKDAFGSCSMGIELFARWKVLEICCTPLFI